MTRMQAHARATALWGTSGTAPGDRVGIATIRRKSVVDRFEVGHFTRVGGSVVNSSYTILGRGRTWEEAFERATSNTRSTT